MESIEVPPKQSPRRRIVIDNEAFGMGNVEAWANIIRSYKALHPEHHVLLFYEGLQVSSMTYLFKLGRPVNRGHFEMSVAAPDQNFAHLPKLYRLLVEGASAEYQQFIVPELHRTLKLF